MLNRYVRMMMIAAACVAGKHVGAMEQTTSSAAAPTTDIVVSLASHDASVASDDVKDTPLMSDRAAHGIVAVKSDDLKMVKAILCTNSLININSGDRYPNTLLIKKPCGPKYLPVGARVPGLGMDVKEGDEIYVMEPGVLSINGMIYQTGL